ncbi:N-acetyltransferase domain-containing protein [Mycena kentingensis (nom. inval.)]|nr:N-acetyltransferase domain-containing protein [Mycena kentingensis (nom. inval.)]
MPVPAPNPAEHLSDRFLVESPELRASVAANTPIRFTSEGEPYIPLPTPFERLYMGPMRKSDIPHDVAMMSDIRVARTIVGPPFPVQVLGAQRWLVREREFMEKLFVGYAAGTFRPTVVDSNPFSVLRERRGDGIEDAYVGQVTVGFRGGASGVRRTPVREGCEAWRKKEGFCDIGAALNVDYHRKGIASAASKVVFDFAVEQMGATEIRAGVLQTNVGSVRLWEKLGFVEDESLRSEVEIDEAKGGGVPTGTCYIWYLK